MRTTLTLVLGCLALALGAQSVPSLVTPAAQRLAAFEQRQALQENSPVAALPFRNIGPSVQSGRVSELAVRPDDPSHFYVAYASGGLWKTENNGTTFEPLFDREAVMTLGAVAVDWSRNTIWLGTGEVNSSRSSYAGLGMYRSTDGGQSWEQRGLPESHHIGRIVLHPDDPNTLWVAVLGHLYSPNRERGIYRTTDGGATWAQTLFVNANAGGIDLVIDPDDPDHLFAATWERTRRAWDFTESGSGSGIYESTDGGANWTLISGPRSGFPNGEGAGRIGLALAKDGNQTILYAAIDNYDRRPAEEPAPYTLTKNELREMTPEAFAELPDYEINDYLRQNGFPREFNARKVRQMVADGEITPLTLVEFTESANSLLFDTEVIGLEVYRTTDDGKSWNKTHEGYLDGVYSSYGYYFGQIRVAPHDPQRLYVMGVPVLRSDDGGKTWRGINAANVHSDHHDLWINPDRPGHIILGNDGGINISYDDGESWVKCNHPPLGQFYYVAVDMADPYHVYGGLQDNGVWMGPHTYQASVGWQGDGHYPYEELLGGDGMQVAIDPRDNETVYTGFQFGFYFRINTRTGERRMIQPQHELGERPYRWNWQTPIHLSEHNHDILYIGSNYLHRSLNRGDDWTTISPDLTEGGQTGDVPYGTLTAIHESPLRFGLLFTGSDDGKVHVSQDGGYSWEDISAGLPDEMWVSRIQASQHQEGRVYLSMNGYRWDNWNSMVYQSDDYGKTWNIIGRNLPQEPVNVIKEDPENEDILYVGTDHGAYISFDRGANFYGLDGGLPAVPVHDIVVHPREHDILIGTHGRSLYLARGTELQMLDAELLASNLHLFELEDVRYSSRWGGVNWYREPYSPELSLPIYVKAPGQAKVTVSVKGGPQVAEFSSPIPMGLNYLSYQCNVSEKFLSEYRNFIAENQEADEKPVVIEAAENGKVYLQPGEYELTVTVGGESATQTFAIKTR
ncbi:MAG: glycosyl hydrolase [Lewinella sp.]|nr:glycosyl hydrolase [Lewinella sp.]